jgi:hypothetical protein
MTMGPTPAAFRDIRRRAVFDGAAGSSNDENELRTMYARIPAACEQANLVANEAKLIEPANAIVAFNCHWTHGQANVTEERIRLYF